MVALNREQVVGCVRVKELADSLELASMAVDPKFQKKGIGTKLLKKLLKEDLRRPIYLLCFQETCPFYKLANFKIIEIDLLPKSLQKEYTRVAEILKYSGKHITAMMVS